MNLYEFNGIGAEESSHKNKPNADILDETYYGYHGKYTEGSEKESYYGFSIVDESEVYA